MGAFVLRWEDPWGRKLERPDSSMTEGYVKTYVFTNVVDVNTSHTPEDGAHRASWPHRLIIIIIIIIYVLTFTAKMAPGSLSGRDSGLYSINQSINQSIYQHQP
jgi:hypothetical protein